MRDAINWTGDSINNSLGVGRGDWLGVMSEEVDVKEFFRRREAKTLRDRGIGGRGWVAGVVAGAYDLLKG